MNVQLADNQRLIRLSAGHVKNFHVPITGNRDFFPVDAVGASTRKAGEGRAIEVALDGLNETIRTDIGSDKATGKPRGFLRV